MNASEIRNKYLEYFESKGHAIIPRANIVPQEDPTTLFTGSGMQPLVPYLLGEAHPAGVRLTDSQPAFRAEDIDEVGDNRHTTLFEMLGNWSLGDYFKAEQIPWFWEFITQEVGLDPERLYMTAFIGDDKFGVPQDTESAGLWQKLFAAKGVEAKVAEIGSEEDGYRRGVKQDEHIFLYDAKKNWWNRGDKGPDTTPVGDPCGPCTEVFYLFDDVKHDTKWGEHCHPNCDCGRYMEIGNSVFMQYLKREDGGLDELPRPNVDFGGGLERIAAAAEGSGDMFRISLLWPIIEHLEELSGKSYDDEPLPMRIIADHLRGAVFLAVDGVVPSNTKQGYVMRRFLRRAIRQGLALGLSDNFLGDVTKLIAGLYRDDYPEIAEHEDMIIRTLMQEEKQFRQTLERGLREFEKLTSESGSLDGNAIFVLSDTYGFPHELSLEEAQVRNIELANGWRAEFDSLLAEQKERSRTATAGQFKGGLAEHNETTTKYHTATHLMYRALRNVLGDHVVQRGSNITNERMRFDFSHHAKMTPEEIKAVEDMVNDAIAKDYPVTWEEMNTTGAFEVGALGAFGDKYGDRVKVYTVGDKDGDWYSKEICGGPHVEHTGEIGTFKIKKEESSSAGVRRIKAVIE
jgi:alanyl-tRNA synthetase